MLVIKDFLTLMGGSIASLIIGLLTTPIITRIILPEEYGKFSFFTMFSNIVLYIIFLGLDQSFIRYYYRNNSLEEKKGLLRKCLCIPAAGAVMTGMILIIIAISTDFKQQQTELIILFVFYIIILVINRFSFLVLRLNFHIKTLAGLNIWNKILYVLTVLGIVFIFHKRDAQTMAIGTAGAVFFVTIAAIVLENNSWKFKRKSDNTNTTYKELLCFGIPLIFSSLLTWLFQGIDKLTIKYYCDFTEVGIYAAANSIIAVFSVITTAFNTLWMPLALEKYESNKNEKNFFVLGNDVITMIMFFIAATVILCKDIVIILLGDDYQGAISIFPFLIFYPIMYTISESTVTGINFKKKSYYHIWISAIVCTTNLLGNLILVPIIGAAGAAISTGLSYIIFFIVRSYLSYKCVPIPYHWKKIGIITIEMILYVFYAMKHFFDINIVIGYGIIIATIYFLYKSIIQKGFKQIQEYRTTFVK